MENLSDVTKKKIKERENELIASEKSLIYKIIEKCTPDKLIDGFENTYILENGTTVQLDKDEHENVNKVFISRDGIRIVAGHFSNEYTRYKEIPDDNGDRRIFDISYEIRNRL